MISGIANVILNGAELNKILILFGHRYANLARLSLLTMTVYCITYRVMRLNYIFSRTDMNAAGTGE